LILVLAAVLSALAIAQDPPAPPQPTYSKEISRIFAAKCQICHRDGDIAPFALNGYDSAVTWSDDIARVLTDKSMPPWKPVAGYGEFRDSFQLTDDERALILTWISDGTPQGDPNDLPDAPVVTGAWPLGAPDATLQMSQVYTPPRGSDVYRCFVLPTNFSGNVYLSAIDVLPGARNIVHHVLLYQDTQGVGDKLDGLDGQPGYPCFGGPGIALSLNNLNASLGGWAPGQRTKMLPDGVGIELIQGAKIIMQIHYYPVGRTGDDQTQIGLYFSKADVHQRLFMIPVLNQKFQIPAGDDNYNVTATLVPFLDAHAIWIYPHMHLLGQQIRADLINLDKSVTPLIFEDSWNFNWQGSYTYKDSIPVPTGSTVRVKCTFNNSDSNPKNPNNPIVPVTWGERTTDEMCLAFAGVTIDLELLLGVTYKNPQNP
jgi:mono/diheme cytochrome c family protein